ncbi:Fez family zinc finger protein 2 [Podospora australis]|uniref:Fez family zinc finger protein 2 n=1 Tax=Podospora australis TaxID=1536484 RepID=A0AAN6WMJ9_9PEZI|nr:Fez family zinc finger protein 2 [Podospora australis]
MDNGYTSSFLGGMGSFNHLPGTQDPAGEPMDLDVDIDDICWAGDFDQPLHSSDPQLSFDASYSHPVPTFPYDLLFAEDEGYLPVVNYHSQPPSFADLPLNQNKDIVPRNPSPRSSDDDLARERLRKQLSLLSKGWCGDEIRFKNCDPAKSHILHNLAIELGLEYKHNVRSREVSICRLEPIDTSPGQHPLSGRLSSSISRSSTELDSTLCLPGTLTFPVSTIEESEFETVPTSSATIDTSREQEPVPTTAPKPQSLVRSPSRSERISDSISKHVSSLRSVAKGGRRGPLTETSRQGMKSLEAVGGACWRCKVLRRKCDTGTPCRLCLQTVSMPYLGEDAPLWPQIGCRRGPLRDSIPVQILCPSFDQPPDSSSQALSKSSRRSRSVDIAERCLLMAESQRLADMKAVFEGASYKLSISDPVLKRTFFSFVEAGRYRDRDSLHREFSCEGKTFTYTELIAIIAWEISENQGLLLLLEVRSWEGFMEMLETACIYEAEVGQTSLVIMSLICLRHCLEGLRLHSGSLLSPGSHDECSASQCQVECIRSLYLRLSGYLDELSSVMFHKENMRDRRWWLSTFYSLCIQSYVRHALIAIEKQLLFKSVDDVPAEDLSTTQYLHLAAVLFTAASAKYDPLIGGRLQYALTEDAVIPETSVPELAHSAARTAFEVNSWADAGIRTSYQFLRKLLQIGSLDFVEQTKIETLKSLPPHRKTSSLSSSMTTDSPITPNPQLSPRSSYRGHRWRDSIDSRFSAHPSTISSNQSYDSLAHAFNTPQSSLYEPSILTTAHSFDLSAEFDRDMDLDGASIDPNIISFSTAPMPSLPPEQRPEAAMSTGADTEPSGFGWSTQTVTQHVGFNEGPSDTVTQHSSSERSKDTVTEQPGLDFVCDCCPRAPRKFATHEELLEHETEKPHPCTDAKCNKRFKSPTEAERHINAIHLKNEYWSCRTLEDPLMAFHSETFHGTVVWDVCGYCGSGFVRKEGQEGDQEKQQEDYEKKLISHLGDIHKFGECDREKKFYRADNFRQHLRGTHVAIPGLWLKALETVCRTYRGDGVGPPS